MSPQRSSRRLSELYSAVWQRQMIGDKKLLKSASRTTVSARGKTSPRAPIGRATKIVRARPRSKRAVMGGSRQLICRNTRAPRTLPIRHVAPPIARVSRSSPRRKAAAAKRFRVSIWKTLKRGIQVALPCDHVDCAADAQLFSPTLATHPRRVRRQRRRASRPHATRPRHLDVATRPRHVVVPRARLGEHELPKPAATGVGPNRRWLGTPWLVEHRNGESPETPPAGGGRRPKLGLPSGPRRFPPRRPIARLGSHYRARWLVALALFSVVKSGRFSHFGAHFRFSCTADKARCHY